MKCVIVILILICMTAVGGTTTTHYDVLDVPVSASEAGIDEAYAVKHGKILELHQRGGETRRALLRQLNEAYAVLSHAESRKQYHAQMGWEEISHSAGHTHSASATSATSASDESGSGETRPFPTQSRASHAGGGGGGGGVPEMGGGEYEALKAAKERRREMKRARSYGVSPPPDGEGEWRNMDAHCLHCTGNMGGHGVELVGSATGADSLLSAFDTFTCSVLCPIPLSPEVSLPIFIVLAVTAVVGSLFLLGQLFACGPRQ